MNNSRIFENILILCVILSLAVNFCAMIKIDTLNTDLKCEKDRVIEKINYINYLEVEKNNWKYMYLNYECPPCPEPETEYIYINSTIYDNNTVYLSTSIFDVTRDGRVDYQDVCRVYSYVQNGLCPVEELFYSKYPNPYNLLFDVNVDGTVNLDDVELILLYSDK
jgi:hypothetical protein